MSRKNLILSGVLCGVMLCAAAVFAQDNRFHKMDDRAVAEIFAQRLEGMTRADQPGHMNGQRQEWQRFCFQVGAPGQEAKRAEAVKLMMEALEDDSASLAHWWLVRQLGRLGGAESVPAVGKFLDSSDRILRDEAVWALANITDGKAEECLRDRLGKESDAGRKTALENALDYRQKKQPVVVVSLDEVMNTLAGGDKTAWDKALAGIPWLKNAQIAGVPDYQNRFKNLTPAAKVLLMDALSQVRDRSALGLAVEMAKSYDAEKDAEDADKQAVAFSGVLAMGRLGDAGTLAVLLDFAKTAQGRAWDYVRDALSQLNFDGADAAIMNACKNAEERDTKIRLMEVLRNRRPASGIPFFVELLGDEDAGVRNQALSALQSAGDLSAIPAMIERFFVEDEDGLRNRMDQIIVYLCTCVDESDGRGEALYRVAVNKGDAEKILVLPLIGRVGGEVNRKFVNEILAGGGPAELKDAAFKALCSWPDASAAEELYVFATSGDDAKSRPAARAYIRVVTLRDEGRQVDDSLELFKKGMTLAKTTEDKVLLLSRIESARNMNVFAFAEQYLDDPELCQAACKALVDIANDHGFYVHNREKVVPVLDRVADMTTDENLKNRIRNYRDRR